MLVYRCMDHTSERRPYLFCHYFIYSLEIWSTFSEDLHPYMLNLGQVVWPGVVQLLLSMLDSALFVTDPSTKDPSEDDGKALIQPPTGKMICCLHLWML